MDLYIHITDKRKEETVAQFAKYRLYNLWMNAAYFQLTKRVLPNAKVVIDCFHIIKHLNQAFNDFRVQEMKRLHQLGQRREAEKVKKNWRF
ncbi:transposase, partial [Enterococcus faecium]|uniref:transposase n=1 Tax=Enterococcus faecium TaxID=1352 RepID=UPI0030FDFF0B